jgi:hypothetical protein
MNDTLISPNIKRKPPSIMFWVLLFALAAGNTLLLKQNLELRGQIKMYGMMLDPARNSLKPGDDVQPFVATDLQGQSYSVTYTGKGPKRVFLFFTPSCKYCDAQASNWRRVLEQTDEGAFQIIGIVRDQEDKTAITDFVNSKISSPKRKLPVLFVPESVLRGFKFSMTPTTMIVNNTGTVENVWAGAWTDSTIPTARAVFNVPL